MIQPFLNQLPIFICNNSDGSSFECYEYNGGCDSEILSPNSPNSLVVQFGLYCSSAYLRSLGGTIFFAGGSLGSIILLGLADKIGRKPIMIISYFLGTLGILGLGIFANSYIMYYFFLSLCWFGFDPYFALSTILANESGGEFFFSRYK